MWTDWYDDRLEGRIRSEAHELHYSGIDRLMWNEGPQVVNAEIKRQIEADEANHSENEFNDSHTIKHGSFYAKTEALRYRYRR